MPSTTSGIASNAQTGATGDRLATLRCPTCGGVLESGFIKSKQSRPRWSSGPEGVTVFAGEPLTALPKGYWFSRAALRAPSLRAARCTQCNLGVFEYDAETSPTRSSRRAGVIALVAALFVIEFAFSATQLTEPAQSSLALPVAASVVSLVGFFGALLALFAESV